MITTSLDRKPAIDFKPERISKCASVELNAPIEKVFPLFGPIREKEWTEGWDPEIIYSNDALVEEHMIFKTKAHPPEDFYIWIVTQFNPDQHYIEYSVSTKNRIWFIRVDCKSMTSKTNATICYTYTGLNEEGNRLNQEALKRMYAKDLKDWAEAINYYLKNGKQLVQH